MSDYTPIDCEIYAKYELAIMHRQRLRLAWRDPNGASHLEIMLPVDLETRDHAEYLHALNGHGEARVLRLDWIIRAEPL